MSEVERYTQATRHAERLVTALGIGALPVDPFAIAEQHDIVVQAKEAASPGVSGCLLKVGDQFGIMYATHIQNEGFIRFSVAHELGHYFLPGHPEYLFAEGEGLHESRSGFVSNDPYELEADHFAAGLLMPSALFVRALRRAGVGFRAIESLAHTCQTSITATAIRFAMYADDPVAVVVSTGSRVDYCFLSEAIKQIRGLTWIRKGESVPWGTETHRFNGNGTNITFGRKSEGWTTLDRWFRGAPAVVMKEDVVGLGDYGKTLTVLFTDEVIDEEDDESALDELDGILSWTSQKRRR